jgi:nitrogen-specific signal transduction histidine kinase
MVEIARSVLAGPQLMLIEESVLNMTQHNLKAGTIDALKYILSLLVQRGMSILLTSNDMDTIFSFADTISIVNCNMIQKTMPVNDIDKFQLVQMAYEFIIARKELEQSNFELFYYKQVYQEIINGLFFPLLVTDTNQQVIIYNKEVQKLCFPEVEQALLQPVSHLLPISEEQVNNIEKKLLDFPASQIHTIEGLIENTKIFVSPVRDSFGSYMGMMYVFSRPGLPIKLEQEFLDQRRHLDMEYRINEIIHEVKNPLGIIINFLRLTKQEESIENIQNFATNIEKEVERINRLLNKLNKSSKPDDVKKLNHAVLPDLYDETVEFLRPVLEESDIKLNVDRSGAIELPFDQDLMRQVILNIMLNAAEAMPWGGILSVSNHTEKENESYHVDITIEDTGLGMSEDQILHIFDPFYTTKHDAKSSGIGLSICREIVENFHGKILVQSTQNKGTIFTIRLPLS